MPSQLVEIDNQDDLGQRIDNFLLSRLKGVPRQHVYKILRSGEVRVNSGRIKATYRLKLGDKVRIPPIKTREQAPIRLQQGLVDQLLAGVMFEDEDFLAVNKPSGIAVHGGSNVQSGVIEQLRLATANPRLELVHRLDRDTSGCLLLSKKASALRAAQQEFRDRRVNKIYLALAWGRWPKQLKTLQARLERYQTANGERRVRVSHKGQQARTDVEVLETSASVSRLRIKIHTGRTHQIRVHLKQEGHAILGDTKYPDPAKPVIERLCLHAHKLEIPGLPTPIKLLVPEPESWNEIWQHQVSRG